MPTKGDHICMFIRDNKPNIVSLNVSGGWVACHITTDQAHQEEVFGRLEYSKNKTEYIDHNGRHLDPKVLYDDVLGVANYLQSLVESGAYTMILIRNSHLFIFFIFYLFFIFFSKTHALFRTSYSLPLCKWIASTAAA